MEDRGPVWRLWSTVHSKLRNPMGDLWRAVAAFRSDRNCIKVPIGGYVKQMRPMCLATREQLPRISLNLKIK